MLNLIKMITIAFQGSRGAGLSEWIQEYLNYFFKFYITSLYIVSAGDLTAIKMKKTQQFINGLTNCPI